jgi:hypothetical protein
VKRRCLAVADVIIVGLVVIVTDPANMHVAGLAVFGVNVEKGREIFI